MTASFARGYAVEVYGPDSGASNNKRPANPPEAPKITLSDKRSSALNICAITMPPMGAKARSKAAVALSIESSADAISVKGRMFPSNAHDIVKGQTARKPASGTFRAAHQASKTIAATHMRSAVRLAGGISVIASFMSK